MHFCLLNYRRRRKFGGRGFSDARIHLGHVEREPQRTRSPSHTGAGAINTVLAGIRKIRLQIIGR